MHSLEQDVSAASRRLPLTLPAELWIELSPAQQAVYRRAEALLDVFTFGRVVPLAKLYDSHHPQEAPASVALVEVQH